MQTKHNPSYKCCKNIVLKLKKVKNVYVLYQIVSQAHKAKQINVKDTVAGKDVMNLAVSQVLYAKQINV